MSVVREGEYLGLPIPNTIEAMVLKSALISDSRADLSLSPEKIYELVDCKRPGIGFFLHLELSDYVRGERPEDMTIEDLQEQVEGIEAGYKFMIGCMTYMYFLRSHQSSVYEFLVDAPRRSPALPLRKLSHFRQAVYASAGVANVEDDILAGLVDNSWESTIQDAERYFEYATGMDALLVDKIDDILTEKAEEDFDLVNCYITGFRLGAETAIGMYVQSYLQEQINISGVSHIVNKAAEQLHKPE